MYETVILRNGKFRQVVLLGLDDLFNGASEFQVNELPISVYRRIMDNLDSSSEPCITISFETENEMRERLDAEILKNRPKLEKLFEALRLEKLQKDKEEREAKKKRYEDDLFDEMDKCKIMERKYNNFDVDYVIVEPYKFFGKLKYRPWTHGCVYTNENGDYVDYGYMGGLGSIYGSKIFETYAEAEKLIPYFNKKMFRRKYEPEIVEENIV